MRESQAQSNERRISLTAEENAKLETLRTEIEQQTGKKINKTDVFRQLFERGIAPKVVEPEPVAPPLTYFQSYTKKRRTLRPV